MIINLIETDPSDNNASAQVKAAWAQAANMLASMFTDNITINISVTYGVTNGSTGGADGGPTSSPIESYASVYSALISRASPGDSTFASLPNASSISGQSSVAVWNAEAKALGFISATGSEVDGTVDFGTGIPLSSMVGVALHEFAHSMGRVPYSGADIMQFYRYTSTGSRYFSDATPASASYFSLNGGNTKWADYGEGSDTSDFLNSQNYSGYGASPLTPEDSFNEYYDSNTLQYLTPMDLEQMDALGFHLKEDAPASDSHDFNGDNSGDVLLQNAGGQIEYANMANGTFHGFVSVANTPGWTVAGAGKISGNASADIVIQNSGQIAYADLVNGAFSKFVSVANAPGYKVVAVGDINEDHYADILIQNPTTWEIGYANMANGVFNNWVNVGTTPGWSAVAVGDFTDNGFDDVVIENKSTGQIGYANMANGVFNNWVTVTGTPGWNVVGAGEITRTGWDNIVIDNPNTGEIAYANMNHGVFNGWISVGSTPGWSVIAVEDILDNGFDDIVIQNNSSGQIAYANMTTGSFQGWTVVGTAAGYTGHTEPADASVAQPDSVVIGSSDANGGGAQAAFASPDAAGASSDADAGSSLLGSDVSTLSFGIEPAPSQQAASGNAGALSGVAMSEPAASNGGALTGMTMSDPVVSRGGGLSAATAFNPTALSGGAPSGDPGPQNDGSAASWLTEGALPGAASVSNAVQNTANSATALVTVDDLTHSLQFGT